MIPYRGYWNINALYDKLQMMDRFVRLFVILFAAVMVASPAVACCLTGHQMAAAQAAQTEPCHDMPAAMHDMSGMEQDTPEQPMDLCPGCDDCAPVLSDAVSWEIDYAPLSSGDDKVIPAAFQIAHQYDHPILERQTGPPDLLVTGYTTPITLKQRLNL